MKIRKAVAAIAAAALAAGCVTTETVRFQPSAQQQALMRDGRAALVSRKKNSIVMVSPASRQFASGGRPVYVVGITNLSKGPMDFRVSDVSVLQKRDGVVVAQLPVKTYDQLAQEERNRQIAAAIIVGLAA